MTKFSAQIFGALIDLRLLRQAKKGRGATVQNCAASTAKASGHDDRPFLLLTNIDKLR